MGNRQYIRHSSSIGLTSWTFDWNAPLTDEGDLIVYYSFNKSNNNGSDSGDPIYLGQYLIKSSFVAELSEYEKMNNEFTANYRISQNVIDVNFKTFRRSNCIIKIYDITGKEILKKEMEELGYGRHKTPINLINRMPKGMYVVSLFIGNQYSNKEKFG